MSLVSLKREDNDDTSCCHSYSGNLYGYGTEISLTREQCEALGLGKAMAAGQPVGVRATGIVVRSGEELSSEGKGITLCIQLTDIEVKTSGSANVKSAAKILYGGDDD